MNSDLERAQRFVRPLTLGVNVERGWAAGLPGDKGLYYRYLRDLGATHVRLFYHYAPSQPQMGGAYDPGIFNAALDGAAAAMGAGLKVLFDVLDVTYPEDVTTHASTTFAWIRDAARIIAGRSFSPDTFACGPFNEPAGETNGFWSSHTQRGLQIMRAELPNHTLLMGGGNWKHHGSLLWPDREAWSGAPRFGHFTPAADLNVVYDWHHYVTGDDSYWRGVARDLAAWRAANGGRPTICGEAGIGWSDEPVPGGDLATAPHMWLGRLNQQLPHLAQERPTLWAVTYGGAWRLNRGRGDARLRPELEGWFREQAARNRAMLGL